VERQVRTTHHPLSPALAREGEREPPIPKNKALALGANIGNVLAGGPDGDIYVAVMNGNKIAHFDTDKQTFNEWDLSPGARPHGLLVDKDGIRKMIVDARGRLWYVGSHNGRLGVVE
jgi:streptogramin lyase